MSNSDQPYSEPYEHAADFHGLNFDPDDPEAHRPRHYAVKDIVDGVRIIRSEFIVQDTVEKLVRMCLRRWQISEGFYGRDYEPEIVVKFNRLIDPWRMEIIASIHEAGKIDRKDIK